MPTANEHKAAIDARNGVAMRNSIVKRSLYAIANSENAADFLANTDGAVCLGLVVNGDVFWLDPADTTSIHDGTTIIVTSDGYRYKLSDFRPRPAVKAIGQVSPPGSPAIGDGYLTHAAPSGAFAGHGEELAYWTTRGWVFVQPRVGELIYVTDGSRRWVFLDEGGAIQSRFDYAPDTLPDTAIIGGQRRYIVESQTVNTPPGSPGLGVYWIIGPAPTGAWLGHAGKIATNYGAGWQIITPANGLEAYDRANSINFIFRTGSGWVPAGGAWERVSRIYTAGSSGFTLTTSGGTRWGGSGAPTTSMRRYVDGSTLTHAASRAGAVLRLTYSVSLFSTTRLTVNNTTERNESLTGFGVFIDSNATATNYAITGEFAVCGTSSTNPNLWIAYPTGGTFTVYLTAADTSPHTYTIAFPGSTCGANEITSATNRLLMIEELSV